MTWPRFLLVALAVCGGVAVLGLLAFTLTYLWALVELTHVFLFIMSRSA